MSYEIVNNAAASRFELNLDGKMALTAYRLSGNHITFLHTEVPKEFEGKGIGSALAKHVLEYAKTNNLQVTPLCPFIKTYLQRHPEYQSLVKPN